MEVLDWFSTHIWNPWLLVLFLGVGLYLTFASNWVQVSALLLWIKLITKRININKTKEKHGITQLQALATSLASTIGTGSIAGVATAIFYGGYGAVFWMWVSAFLGMATGCIEKILSVQYQVIHSDGRHLGGPMYYILYGLRCPWLARIFACFCLLASLCGGNMVQANSIATALSNSFGWNPFIIGVVVAIASGMIIWGGIHSIGRMSERLVPAMALLFLMGGGFVLYHHRYAIPSTLLTIVSSAFDFDAMIGGGLGYTVSQAMRYGIARGVFTNEAGMGSSAIAHGAAKVSHPAQEGLWGIFEVFCSTMVVCTVTALSILCSGVYSPQIALSAIANDAVTSSMTGVSLTMAAFQTALGPVGGYLISLCLLLFAFTSLLGWSYYGVCSLTFLTGQSSYEKYYYIIYMVMIVLGSIGDVSAVWLLADIFNGLMALPNLIAIFLLAPVGIRLWKEWAKM